MEKNLYKPFRCVDNIHKISKTAEVLKLETPNK